MSLSRIVGPFKSDLGFQVGVDAAIPVISETGIVFLKKATSAPVNAVAAKGELTVTGGVSNGEKVVIGSKVYEADTDNTIVEGSVKVDISAGTKAQASGTFTLSGVVNDGETVTIGDEIYEFTYSGAASEGNVAVDLSAAVAAATATLTFTGVVADAETVTIGDKVYEFDTNGAVGAGHIRVDVKAAQTATAAVTALTVVINAQADELVAAADGAGDTVVVTAKTKGVAGNDIAVATTGVNASWGADVTKLSSGQSAAAIASATALATAVTANTALDVAATDGGDGTVAIACDAAGDLDGSAGHAIVTETTCANGEWGAATLVGGGDATAAQFITAFIAAAAQDANVVVAAVDGQTGKASVTAKVKGAAGNSIATTETLANGSFAEVTLTGGVSGTVAGAGATMFDGSYLYVAVAANTVADANWRRISLGSAY